MKLPPTRSNDVIFILQDEYNDLLYKISILELNIDELKEQYARAIAVIKSQHRALTKGDYNG